MVTANPLMVRVCDPTVAVSEVLVQAEFEASGVQPASHVSEIISRGVSITGPEPVTAFSQR